MVTVKALISWYSADGQMRRSARWQAARRRLWAGGGRSHKTLSRRLEKATVAEEWERAHAVLYFILCATMKNEIQTFMEKHLQLQYDH